MTQVQIDSAERIKQHFAVRVINEARIILEVWQSTQTQEWSKQSAEIMLTAAQRLKKYAERFEQNAHAQIALDLLATLDKISANRGRLTSERIEEMTQLMQKLTQTGLRQDDRSAAGFVVPRLRRPVYIALSCATQAQHLSTQLAYFRVQSEVFVDAQTFKQAVIKRRPPVIILDVDFVEPEYGLALAQSIQPELDATIPVIFYSQHEAEALVRLAAVRAGGAGFMVGELETSGLLELVESFSRTSHFDPFKVLVVDDSKAQSLFIERTLNAAAIITRSVNDPTLALAQIMDFSPDLLILDMYMPECSGPELAKVIRQSERFVSLPIIFLSGEEDLGKQLNAMSQGADDFLTKPVMPHHLIATVRNRAVRARNLKARIVRDSLTGLYGHTHILQLLDDELVRAQKTGQPLSFVMLDIDFFKKVNDTHGHPAGDKVIKSLALYLQQRLRKTDHIGRYGGEEFALVLPNTCVNNAAKVVNEIRQGFAEISFPTQTQDISCTFSAGVARSMEGLDTMQLASLADEALYVAKNRGRNQVAIAEQSTPTE